MEKKLSASRYLRLKEDFVIQEVLLKHLILGLIDLERELEYAQKTRRPLPVFNHLEKRVAGRKVLGWLVALVGSSFHPQRRPIGPGETE